MVENHITINGMPGTGKTAVAKLLCEENGYELISAIMLHEAIAKKLKTDTCDFLDLLNSNTQLQKRYDKMINRTIIEKANEHSGKKTVFNTRAAFSLLKNAVHVLLTVEPDVAIKRLYNSDYSSGRIMELSEKVRKEAEKEELRFSRQLHASYLNEVHYDIVIDTTHLDVSEVKQLVHYRCMELLTKRSMLALDSKR